MSTTTTAGVNTVTVDWYSQRLGSPRCFFFNLFRSIPKTASLFRRGMRRPNGWSLRWTNGDVKRDRKSKKIVNSGSPPSIRGALPSITKTSLKSKKMGSFWSRNSCLKVFFCFSFRIFSGERGESVGIWRIWPQTCRVKNSATRAFNTNQHTLVNSHYQETARLFWTFNFSEDLISGWLGHCWG